MPEDFELAEPGDDFRYLSIDELRAIKTNHKEIKSVTHQNNLSRWYNLEGFSLRESYHFVIGISCDFRPLLVVLYYDAEQNSYVYQNIGLANGEELKRFWCR
ncbi:hypothetical protein [Nibrella viscosa]